MAGAETWHRILNAIERLQAKAPRTGRTCIEGRRGISDTNDRCESAARFITTLKAAYGAHDSR
jgi:hypothetical protein